MKSLISPLFVIPAALCLTQCVVVPTDSSDQPGQTASSQQSGYELGMTKGLADGRGGLSRTPDRYSYLCTEADRADYFRGYEAGYNQGIR